MALTSRREKFCQNVAAGLSQTQAYVEAYPNAERWKEGTAASRASDMARQPEVQARIAELRGKVVEKQTWDIAKVQDAVLQHAWDELTADPSDLITHRRLNCRYCHGKDHAYRWKNEPEFWEALGQASEQQDAWENTPAKERRGKRPELPTDDGGYGFRRLHMPHPDCPECEGEGIEETRVADIRTLSGPARALYRGVKVKKDGSIEVMTGDKAAARALLANWAGVTQNALKVSGAIGVMPVPTLSPEQAAAVALALENKI
jgi:phage terminase small subunit